MGTMIACDKCGAIAKNINGYMHIRAYRLTGPDKYMSNAIKYIDVCKNCYEKIFNNESEEK